MKRCRVDVKKPNKREARKRHAARRATSNWGWQDGVVNVEGEHIELRYGDGETTAYEQWLPIALIGKPTNHVFPVRWIMSRDSRSRQRMSTRKGSPALGIRGGMRFITATRLRTCIPACTGHTSRTEIVNSDMRA